MTIQRLAMLPIHPAMTVALLFQKPDPCPTVKNCPMSAKILNLKPTSPQSMNPGARRECAVLYKTTKTERSQADKLAADPRPQVYRAFRRPLDAAEQVSPKLDSIPSLPSTGHATAAQESAQESLPSTRCPHTRFPHRAACMEHAYNGNSGPRSTRTAP